MMTYNSVTSQDLSAAGAGLVTVPARGTPMSRLVYTLEVKTISPRAILGVHAK